MAQIDTHRASYNKPNGNIRCGSAKAEKNLTPSITTDERSFYTVQLPTTTRRVNTLPEVNALLRVHSNAKVVKTTRVVTTETRHQRIR